MYQIPQPPAETLPTMYDLPSEDPEEPGLPDLFHLSQPRLLDETLRLPDDLGQAVFTASDLNVYYDPRHPLWYKRPDWFLCLDVEAGTEQQDLRWSYVIWQEGVAPLLVVELLSPGTEAEDLGQKLRELSQPPGKWEVYERILRVPYYVVFDRYTNKLRLFQLMPTHYQEVSLQDQRFWFAALQLGLGVWQGAYQGVMGRWLRWYDQAGNWIPTQAERAEQEQQRAEQEQQRAEQERQRAEQAEQQVETAIPRLAQMGLTARQIAEVLSLPVVEVERQLPSESGESG
jgi:Uma2 family endonuclease